MLERYMIILLLWTDQHRADTVGPSRDHLLQMPNLETLAEASLAAEAVRDSDAAKVAALKAKTDQLETLLTSISAE